MVKYTGDPVQGLWWTVLVGAGAGRGIGASSEACAETWIVKLLVTLFLFPVGAVWNTLDVLSMIIIGAHLGCKKYNLNAPMKKRFLHNRIAAAIVVILIWVAFGVLISSGVSFIQKQSRVDKDEKKRVSFNLKKNRTYFK